MFDFEAFVGYIFNKYLLIGVLVTLGLTVFPIITGLIVGTFIALARSSPVRLLSWCAKFYIWLFRGILLLVLLVIIYTGLPQIGIRLDVISSVLLAFTLNEAAYLAEVIRAGLLGVPRGQRDAS